MKAFSRFNAVAPRRVPWSRDIVFPSHSDRLAYAYGFLDRSKPLDELRRQVLITPKAQASGAAPTSRAASESPERSGLSATPVLRRNLVPRARS